MVVFCVAQIKFNRLTRDSQQRAIRPESPPPQNAPSPPTAGCTATATNQLLPPQTHRRVLQLHQVCPPSPNANHDSRRCNPPATPVAPASFRPAIADSSDNPRHVA